MRGKMRDLHNPTPDVTGGGAAPHPAIPDLPATDPAARGWTSQDLHATQLFFDLSAPALRQVRAGLAFAHANGLTVDTVEQEDFRVPAFAADVPGIHEQLDRGIGIAILRGLDPSAISESDAEIVAWGLCNYLGRPVRQGIATDRRLFTVADRGAANTDPTRIGASARRSAKHTDNGCLEPRPPCYIGLLCYRAAGEGGESTIISARTVYETIVRERPDLLAVCFQRYHFRAPQLHVWPSRGPTIEKPILEAAHGELRIHYARVMIEPGMEMAGTPLNARQREALDFLDEVIERPGLCFRHRLQPGEILLVNNLAMLHGREAFTPDPQAGRILKRIWMWRRHVGPGVDPVALDLEELA